MVAYAAMIIAAAIVAFGILGEIISLLALAHGHDSATARMVILWSIIGLLLLTAAGRAWALNTTWVRLQWVQLRTAWRMLWPTHHVIVVELGPAVVAASGDDANLARNHRPNCRASLIPSWTRGATGSRIRRVP